MEKHKHTQCRVPDPTIQLESPWQGNPCKFEYLEVPQERANTLQAGSQEVTTVGKLVEKVLKNRFAEQKTLTKVVEASMF